MTEVSNLTRKHPKPMDADIALSLATYVNSSIEIYVPTNSVVRDQDFLRLGVTDCAILQALEERDAVLLTTDAALHVAALSRGLLAINFNHLRSQRPDFGLR